METYGVVIAEILKLKGPGILKNQKLFCACLGDIGGTAWRRETNILTRNIDDQALRILYDAVVAQNPQIDIVQRRIASIFTDDMGLAVDISEYLAHELTSGVDLYAGRTTMTSSQEVADPQKTLSDWRGELHGEDVARTVDSSIPNAENQVNAGYQPLARDSGSERGSALNLAVGERLVLRVSPSGGVEQSQVTWRVLAVDEERALIISDNGLECRKFNESRSGNDWDKSSLKTWLETSFKDAIFPFAPPDLVPFGCLRIERTSDRRLPAVLPNGLKVELDGAPFCLSVAEASQYFANDNDRICSNPAGKGSEDSACRWWLSTKGSFNGCVAFVRGDGRIDKQGDSSSAGYISVRPAMWIRAFAGDDRLGENDLSSEVVGAPIRGDRVALGNYPTDSAGKAPIMWRVLDVNKSGQTLLLSEKGLAYLPFNATQSGGCEWATSDLKKWLENDFVNEAFTDVETSHFDGLPYCLTAEEADAYSYPRCGCRWWLQGPGQNGDHVAIVDELNYGINEDWAFVASSDIAVRPALRVNLAS